MTGPLPSTREAMQLHKLRGLRVQRAREQLSQARLAREQAAAVVAERQQKIDAGEAAIEALAQAVITTLVPRLPRWHGMVAAERARLLDRLERDVDAMITERNKLDAADQAIRQAEVALSRATAREDISSDLVRDVRRAQQAGADARAELELEDQARRAAKLGAATA